MTTQDVAQAMVDNGLGVGFVDIMGIDEQLKQVDLDPQRKVEQPRPFPRVANDDEIRAKRERDEREGMEREPTNSFVRIRTHVRGPNLGSDIEDISIHRVPTTWRTRDWTSRLTSRTTTVLYLAARAVIQVAREQGRYMSPWLPALRTKLYHRARKGELLVPLRYLTLHPEIAHYTIEDHALERVKIWQVELFVEAPPYGGDLSNLLASKCFWSEYESYWTDFPRQKLFSGLPSDPEITTAISHCTVEMGPPDELVTRIMKEATINYTSSQEKSVEGSPRKRTKPGQYLGGSALDHRR